MIKTFLVLAAGITLYGSVSNLGWTVELGEDGHHVCYLGGLRNEQSAKYLAKLYRNSSIWITRNGIHFTHFRGGKHEGKPCLHQFDAVQIEDDGTPWIDFDSYDP